MLARSIAQDLNGMYFGLERPSDRRKLSDPELVLRGLADRLVVLDAVQRTAGLFEVLRPLIDEKRTPGRFLLLGPASPDLLHQASESLAGRMGMVKLAPLVLPRSALALIPCRATCCAVDSRRAACRAGQLLPHGTRRRS